MRGLFNTDNRYTVAPVMIFALSAFISSVLFMLGITCAAIPVIAAVILTILFGVLTDRKIVVSAGITVLAIAVFSFFCSFVYDMSFDGTYFHKEAVNCIAKGWNPLYTSFKSFSPFGDLQDLSLWLDNYPKGVWSFYAGIMNITGSLEAAKGGNMVFVLMLFFAAMDTLKTVFKRRGFVLIALALVFTLNPVIVSQLFTFMNDLPTAVLIMVCAFLGMKIYAEKADRLDYVTLVCAFASSFTVKFTAPVFCGITLLAYGIAYMIKCRDKRIIRPVVAVIAAAVFGVFIMGADPYFKHMLDGIHPIYPVMGEGKYDIMNVNRPEGFDDMSTPGRFVTSVFSQASPNPGDEAKLKIPFSVQKGELDAVSAADVRLSGFGVLFSGILIISFILGMISLYKAKKFAPYVPAVLIFTLMGLFFPESWWARYNPYFYYVPCILLLAFSTIHRVRSITCAVSLLFAVNSLIGGYAVVDNFSTQTAYVKKTIRRIKETDKTVLLRINDFPGHVIWFEEAGIRYELLKSAADDSFSVFHGTTKYKFKEAE